jgi:hypothetical protein
MFWTLVYKTCCVLQMKPTKVLIVPDKDVEEFTISKCKCCSCMATNRAVAEWDSFTPTTALQKKMIKVVKSITKRERK